MSQLLKKAGISLVLASSGVLSIGASAWQHPAEAPAPMPIAAAATTQAATVQVRIDNFTFTPAALSIPAGTKVVWTNGDDVPHTVTSSAKPRAFASPALDTDDQFSHVFTTPGVYAYFCAVHPHMTGQITVK